MYAVVKIKGMQYRVEAGARLQVPLLENEVDGKPSKIPAFGYLRHYLNRLAWPPNPNTPLDRDYTPEGGQANPFLHMGLHLGIREQVATDRPAGLPA